MNLSEFHPTVQAVNAADFQAGTLTRVSQAITQGAPAALASGLLSIVNTGLDYVGAEQFDEAETIGRLLGESTEEYYRENQTAVDVVGFIGAAILPGMAGVKALKLARGGQAVGNFGRYLGFANTAKHKHLKAALDEIPTSGGMLRTILQSRARQKHLGFEVLDNVQDSLAAELGILIAMHDSPLFDDWSYQDFMWNMALGGALGGAIGGVAGSVVARGALIKSVDTINRDMRRVDTFLDPKKLGLEPGTEIAAFIADIYRKSETGKLRTVSFNYDGATQQHTFDLSKLLTDTKAKAQKQGLDEVGIKFNSLARGNVHLGQAYRDFVMGSIDSAVNSGATPQKAVLEVYNKLNFVAHIEPATEEGLDAIRAALNAPKPTHIAATSQTPALDVDIEFHPNVVNTDAYRFSVIPRDLDTPAKIQHFLKTNKDDFGIVAGTGKVIRNKKSALIKRVAVAPRKVSMAIDLQTGTVSPEGTTLFGDTIHKERVSYNISGVVQNGKFTPQVFSAATDLTASGFSNTMRMGWMSQLNSSDFKNFLAKADNTIPAEDIPALMRLAESIDEGQIDTLMIDKIKVGATPLRDILLNTTLEKHINELRLRMAATHYATNGPGDLASIAGSLGVDYKWMEDAVEDAFQATPRLLDAKFHTADSLKPRTVLATFDFDSLRNAAPIDTFIHTQGPGFASTAVMATKLRIEANKIVADRAVTDALGEFSDFIVDMDNFRRGIGSVNEPLTATTNTRGAGASFLSASDADYGSGAEIAAQEAGKELAHGSLLYKEQLFKSMAADVSRVKGMPEVAAELGALTTAIRGNSRGMIVVANTAGSNLDEAVDIKTALSGGSSRPPEYAIVSIEAYKLARSKRISLDEAVQKLSTQLRPDDPPHVYRPTADAGEFFAKQMQTNKRFLESEAPLANAIGLTKYTGAETTLAYAPPINTAKYPYHAFVKTKQGFGTHTDVGMLVARTEDELRELTRALGDDFDVYFDKNVKDYYLAKGQYEYGLTLRENLVNSELAKRGKLRDHMPETRAENVLTDYLEWHSARVDKLFRTALQIKNQATFNQLDFLSKQYMTIPTSRTGGVGAKMAAQVTDPFGEYIKTAMNLSKQQEFVLLSALNEIIDKVGISFGAALNNAWHDAKTGVISWEEANKVMGRYGLGNPYNTYEAYLAANTVYPRNVIRETSQKLSMILATTMLRFDHANSLINIVSTPIMLGTEVASIKRRLKAGDPLLGKLKELTHVKVPGQDKVVPSTAKLIWNAVNNFGSPQGKALTERYIKNGAIKSVLMQWHEVMDMVSYTPGLSAGKWSETIDKAVEKTATLTGNNFSELFTRFVSADAMRQLTDPLVDAGRMTLREQDAYINTFVNRVQGNYTTSQRPILFQGTTGSAISLFQTYVFNVLRQLFRHTQAGDKKTLAVFAGLQSAVFGLNGLPGFEAINTHLVSNLMAGNPDNQDAYTVLHGFNPEVGNWLLYGTASAFPLFPAEHTPALFTRGDINPRHITVVPTSFVDIPTVSASIRLVDAITSTGRSILQGADVTDSLLRGLEHNGWNRPLAGFAQLLGGQSVTRSHSLISAHGDMDSTFFLAAMGERVIEYGGITRLMGARPMNEAVALDAYYRQTAYRALDRARIERIGRAVKTKLEAGQMPTEEEYISFLEQYTSAGGRVELFQQAMNRWTRDANVSIVNRLADINGNPYGQTLQELMGGERLPDHRTIPDGALEGLVR